MGRLATQVARILRGKHKPDFSTHLDVGDYVIIINAERIKVTALADTDVSKAETFRERYGGECATDDPGRVFGDRNVDAVLIATWHDTHAPLSLAALQSGKHVVIEKPMVMTEKECDDVVAAVKLALPGSLQPRPLAEQLSLDRIDAVTVTDAEGTPLGEAFPERGVLFMFATPLAEATTTAAVTAAVKPRTNSGVVAAINMLNTSRPRASVPSQCLAEGVEGCIIIGSNPVLG